MALCAGCHAYYTVRPTEWEVWIEGRMGTEARVELRRQALTIQKPDYDQIISWLEEELNAKDST